MVGLDVEHGELHEVRDGGEGVERRAPVHGPCDVTGLECRGIEEMDGVADAGADCQGADVGEGPGLFQGDAHEIVFADRGNLDGVGEFEVGGVVVGVGGDDLFGGFGTV